MARAADETLHFRGSPHSVRGFVPIPHGEMAVEPRHVVLGSGGSQHHIPLQTVPRGGHTDLRFTLPSDTRPGEYRGTVHIGERQFTIVANVEERIHLSCIPPQLDVPSAMGASETLTIVNDGNASVRIGRRYAFGLFETRGLDRAIGRTFGPRSDEGRSRLDRLVDSLADEYGGIATAHVEHGAGAIEPGEVRSVRLTLHFSESVRAGHRYFGYLNIANLNIPVTVGERRQGTEDTNGEHAAEPERSY